MDNFYWQDMLIIRLTILLSLSAFLASCATQPRAADANKIKVGIVFDIGGKDDRSFNTAANEGVKRAKAELPIVLRDAEPGDATSLEPAMRAFAQYGYNLIIGVGFAQAPILEIGRAHV